MCSEDAREGRHFFFAGRRFRFSSAAHPTKRGEACEVTRKGYGEEGESSVEELGGKSLIREEKGLG